MKRIVVTGATSMIGLALIEECLKHNIEIYAVVRKASSKTERLPQSPLIHVAECELDQFEKLPELIPEGCDTFYQIAWGNTGENRNRSTEVQCQNIQYTLDAVRAAHKIGCRRFIGAGSQAEHGPIEHGKISPETMTKPNTPYGASKLAAGHLARMLCKELGMSCIWPRVFSVYGIYEKETTMVASGLRKMIAGEPTEFTPAMQWWDYLYSKDAGRAFYLIGERGRDDAIYCVGSGISRPLVTYIEQMAKVTGAKELGIGEKPYPPGTIMNLCADITSLKEDTGFVPEYTFAKGIRETAQWIRQQNAGEEE